MRSARRAGSVCCGSACRSDTANVASLASGCYGSLVNGGGRRFQRGDVREGHVRSTPAENVFSKAEDRTTTRTVGSSAIRSNAAPYSRQNLLHIFVHVTVNRSPSQSIACVRLVECIHRWPKRERSDISCEALRGGLVGERGKKLHLLSSMRSTFSDGKLMTMCLNRVAYGGAIGGMVRSGESRM